MKIIELNHVWAADVTFIPMACGFLYLVVIIDWASRAVLAWRLSNTNDASFCAAALEEALLRFGTPRIFNTDQGSTFTAEAFAGKLAATGVSIGKKRKRHRAGARISVTLYSIPNAAGSRKRGDNSNLLVIE